MWVERGVRGEEEKSLMLALLHSYSETVSRGSHLTWFLARLVLGITTNSLAENGIVVLEARHGATIECRQCQLLEGYMCIIDALLLLLLQ